MARLTGLTHDEMRRSNLASLLRLLHVQGPSTRSELAARTGLNRSTVAGLTSALVASGLVRETEPERGGGVGRPSIVVEPASERVYVLAFDFQVDRTVAAAVGLGGRQLLRRTRVHPRQGLTPAAATKEIAALSAALVQESAAGALCVGVGIAVPGVVRHRDGTVRFAPNLGWVDVPLGSSVTATLGRRLAVAVGNDADLGALAEHVRGAARHVDDVVYLGGGVGVGGGIILGGRPMKGAGGYGGEIGHMVVNPRGRACRCGGRGCWETEIGEQALLAAAGLDDGAHSYADVLAAAQAGDRRARAGARRVGGWLGVGLVNLVNLFNPEVVVIGGAFQETFALMEAAAMDRLSHAMPAPLAQVRVRLPELGADSTLLGAAESAFEPLLLDPLGTLAAIAGRTDAHHEARPARTG